MACSTPTPSRYIRGAGRRRTSPPIHFSRSRRLSSLPDRPAGWRDRQRVALGDRTCHRAERLRTSDPLASHGEGGCQRLSHWRNLAGPVRKRQQGCRKASGTSARQRRLRSHHHQQDDDRDPGCGFPFLRVHTDRSSNSLARHRVLRFRTRRWPASPGSRRGRSIRLRTNPLDSYSTPTATENGKSRSPR